jgi:hypothetical protein
MTDPTSHQRGLPPNDKTVTFKKKKSYLWSKVPDWALHQDILTDDCVSCSVTLTLTLTVNPPKGKNWKYRTALT